MRVKEICHYHDFLALEETWNDVLRRCQHTIFSTWEWLTTWWKYFGNNKRLLLLLAEENDKIMGMAPLMYSVHQMFGLRMGKIEFIGTPDSDYTDFLIADKEEECIKLFINHLNTIPEKWDCIELRDIPENSKCLQLLSKMSNSNPIHMFTRAQCPYVSLPKSYDVFLKGLSSKLRKDLRRNLRRLDRSFKVEFAEYSEAQSFNEGMNCFFRLHQKRWESKGFSGVFDHQKIRDFHLDIAKSFSQKGWLGLFLLNLSNDPAASLYGFKYQSKFYYYLSGFDPRYRKYSVGNLLISHIISKCIQGRLREFDFMRGAETYKDRWNSTARWNHQAVLTRKGLLANFENWLYKQYWHQGNRLKYLLKMQ
jgi:CelD/BcsL family acetyltransferase involved in cellulose biosynthesis